MGEPAEEHLRKLIRSGRGDTAEAGRLAAVAVRRARQRRDHLWAWVSASSLVAAAAGTAAVVAGGPNRGAPLAERSIPVPSSGAVGSPTTDAAVPEVGGGCRGHYSAKRVADLGFAFDGTIIDISPAPPSRSPAVVSARFAVREWFRGGPAATMTVDLARPEDGAVGGAMSAYRVGSRLLVSGRTGRGGEPPDGPVAGTCGVTRPYDPATARAWRSAFGSPGRTSVSG